MASLDQLIANARQLPREERAHLAHEMLRSLDEPDGDTPDEGVAEAWAAEIARRARAVEDGTAVLEDWADVRQRIREQLQRSQLRTRSPGQRAADRVRPQRSRPCETAAQQTA